MFSNLQRKENMTKEYIDYSIQYVQGQPCTLNLFQKFKGIKINKYQLLLYKDSMLHHYLKSKQIDKVIGDTLKVVKFYDKFAELQIKHPFDQPFYLTLHKDKYFDNKHLVDEIMNLKQKMQKQNQKTQKIQTDLRQEIKTLKNQLFSLKSSYQCPRTSNNEIKPEVNNRYHELNNSQTKAFQLFNTTNKSNLNLNPFMNSSVSNRNELENLKKKMNNSENKQFSIFNKQAQKQLGSFKSQLKTVFNIPDYHLKLGLDRSNKIGQTSLFGPISKQSSNTQNINSSNISFPQNTKKQVQAGDNKPYLENNKKQDVISSKVKEIDENEQKRRRNIQSSDDSEDYNHNKKTRFFNVYIDGNDSQNQDSDN